MSIIVSSRLSRLIGTVIDLARLKGFDALGKKFGIEPPAKKLSPPPKDLATAPYNFVSLPKKVLPAQFEDVDGFKEHIGAAGNISGEILLDIEALTPLFIGGGQDDTKTFAPVGSPIIPGSSLRGMVKNILKIVTCGAFRGQTDSQKNGDDFNDEHIYFRCLMKNNKAELKGYNWSVALHAYYVKRMSRDVDKDGKKITVKNARPGFLIRKADGKYFIAPSIYTSDRAEDFITIKDFQTKYGEVGFRDSRIQMAGAIAYIVTGNQWANKPERLLDAAAYEKFKANLKILREKLDDKKIDKKAYDDEARKHGKQIIRFTSLLYIEPNREEWFEVPEEVLRSYRRDRNRGGVDLFKGEFLVREDKRKGALKRDELERRTGQDYPDVDTIIPCHFLTKEIADDKSVVTAFGHGQCFRIPYKKSIGDVAKISGSDAIDFADAVFGKEKFWASRVYFEDAAPVGKISELPTATAHPLMQPNPTSYQLYLKQNDDRELKHWDSDGAQVRGYKLYWHKRDVDWKANADELKLDRGKSSEKRLTQDITPLDKGNKFTAKIRFKNLSAEELGALMMVFDLNGATNAAYKIGKGKPFGLGSIRIKPTLFVESDDAYTELFDGGGWHNPCLKKNPSEYLDAFQKYLKTRDMYKVWQNVMEELNMILDWSPTQRDGWSEYIKTMSGNVSKKDNVDERFIQRARLQKIKSIFEVVK